MSFSAVQLERRKNLARAVKRAKKGEEISLEMLAHLWKVTKARFVNVKAQIENFPDPSSKDAKTGALSYPAVETLKAMVDWEHRDDAVAAEKVKRHRRLLGGGEDEAPPEDEIILPPSELLKYDQLSTSLQRREIEQNNLLRSADVAARAAEAFSKMASVCGSLANVTDPNGQWDPEVRASVDLAGRDLLFALHADMSSLFGDGEAPPVELPRATDEAPKPKRSPRRTSPRRKA
jgi:hypothetical protein